MDIRQSALLLSALKRLTDPNVINEPMIGLKSGKPPFDAKKAGTPIPRKTPEEAGTDTEYICRYLRALKDCRQTDMHSVMILRDSAVIAEYGFGAYKTVVWQITHSECKSITGLAIGILIHEGRLRLDEKITDIFGKRAGILSLLSHKNITVRDLLTMTTGVGFAEANAMAARDWVKGYFGASVDASGKFAYNSLNTYMLSAIITEKTGLGLTEYLRPRLFDKLGIGDVFWEKCPMGIEKGGWGLYIRPQDIAKIGLLVMQNGVWNGEQIVPAAWIKQSCAPQVSVPEGLGDYDYGYQIWVGRKCKSFLFNGMFGQNVLGFPGSGVLVVSNAGNSETFQQNPFYSITSGFFGKALPKPEKCPFIKRAFICASTAKYLRREKKTAFFRYASQHRFIRSLDGFSYRCDASRTQAFGLYPFITQAMQNNYTSGLREIAFSFKNGKLSVTVFEKDDVNTFTVGFMRPEYTTLRFGNETQLAAVSGRFAYNEDDAAVIIIRINLLEMSNTRFIKLVFGKDTIDSIWYESPGKEYIAALASSFAGKRRIPSLVARDSAQLEYKLERVIEPHILFNRTAKNAQKST